MPKKYLNTFTTILFIAALMLTAVSGFPTVKVANAATITVYCDGTAASPAAPTDAPGGTEVDESTWAPVDQITFLQGNNDGYCVLDSVISVTSVTVGNGSDTVFLTHAAEASDGIAITTSGDLTINSGSGINVDEKGCAGGSGGDGRGPDATNVCGTGGGYDGFGNGVASNTYAAGAGHGDEGGTYGSYEGGNYYGSNIAPNKFGAGGGGTNFGAGGDGGGLVILNISGELIFNGSISADAGDGLSNGGGGGSGGSIFITTGDISGSGSFSAGGGDGGATAGGNGAGGRIAVIYDTASFSFDNSDFSVSPGAVTSSTTEASYGSVYVKDATNNDVTVYQGFDLNTDYSVRNFTIDSNATNVFCDGSADATPSITASGTMTLGGTINCIDALVTGFDTSVGTAASFDALTFTLSDELIWTMDDAKPVSVINSSTINANVNWTNVTTMTIDGTSSINADGRGCSGGVRADGEAPDVSNVCGANDGRGEGASSNAYASGAGHGSMGGTTGYWAGGAYYGSNTAPNKFGAGGGGTNFGDGGDGGGVIILDVDTLTMNGTLSADATNGLSNGGGGGSGGSVNVVVGSISGSGSFTAEGGDGGATDGGNGAGGRIAVVYDTTSFVFDSSDFSVAAGTYNGGLTPASYGTVYVKDTTNNDLEIYHGLTIDSDFSGRNITIDAANVYCDGTTDATPSFAASGTLEISGGLDCTDSSVTSFTTSAGTSVSLDDLTVTLVDEAIWGMTSAVPVTLSKTASGTTINANVEWIGIASLSVDGFSSINADGRGCAKGVYGTHGSGPNSSNVCSPGTAGYGKTYSGNGAGSGAGHGGVGANSGYLTGGVTYNEEIVPDLFGSGGGGVNGRDGGDGGGLIRISTAGNMAVSGDFSVDGENAEGSDGFGAGGGSGGSIYLTIGGVFSGTDGTLTAIGGDANVAAGGAGGGGRIRVEYGDGDTSNYLSGLAAGTVCSAGGVSTNLAGDGTLSVAQVPILSSITIAENTNDTTPEITVSAGGSTATDIAFSCNGGTDWSAWITYPDDDVLNDGDGPVFDITSGATGCTATEESKTITAKVKAAGDVESGTASDTTTYDITAPQVSNVTANNLDGTYGVGVDLGIQVVFDENVNFSGTSVDIELDFDGVDRTATYSSGTGTTVLLLTYTTQNGDNKTDLAYTGTDALTLNSATLTDAAGNAAVLTLPSPGGANSLSADKDINISTNLVPTASVTSVAQSTDGTGDVNVSMQVDDPDDDDTLRVKVEYSLDGGSTWADPTISTTDAETTATYGDPSVDNAQTYQIGQSGAYITTSSGVNTVSFVWEAATDVDASTDISNAQVRLTPYDGTAAGSASASSDFILDLVAPSGLADFTNTAKAPKSASFEWTASSDTNFSHYEIWYASYESEVTNRTGYAVEYDNDDDADLAAAATTGATLVVNVPYGRYFAVYAVDDFGNYETVSALQVEEDPDSVGFFGGSSHNTSSSDTSGSEGSDVEEETEEREGRPFITVVRPSGAVEVEVPDHWSENYLKNLGEDDRVVEEAFLRDDFFELLIELIEKPDGLMTRGDALQVAVVLGGLDYQSIQYSGAFTDVPEDHEQMRYIEYAYQSGLITGYPDGSFAPDREINRVEALKIATMVYGWPVTDRFLGDQLLGFYFMESAPFADVNMSTWYSPYLAPAVAYTVVQGYGSYFLPSSKVSYAEFVKMITLLRTAYDAVELASEME